MEHGYLLTNRCFKSVCLWSLLCDLVVFAIFIAGFVLTVVITSGSHNSSLGKGLGWLIIVFPTILAKIISIVLFAVANGYLAFIFYSEYKKKEQSLPLGIVNRTEYIFNQRVTNDLAYKVINFVSICSFVFNVLILIINFYAILIGLASFAILTVRHQKV